MLTALHDCMQHVSFSRKEGRARSAAKTAANRAKAAAFWTAVRSGAKPAPSRPRVPPPPEELAARLAPYCRQNGIRKLEVFGSVARGEARRGSDVDLIATFSRPVGLRFFVMADEIAQILGTPVDLLERQTVDTMTNPIRKASILADAQEIIAL